MVEVCWIPPSVRESVLSRSNEFFPGVDIVWDRVNVPSPRVIVVEFFTGRLSVFLRALETSRCSNLQSALGAVSATVVVRFLRRNGLLNFQRFG